MKPFLRYVGGKTWLVPIFQYLTRNTLTKNTTLVELFAGSGALSLALEQKSVVLNDVNTSLMQLWNNIALNQPPRLTTCSDELDYKVRRAEFNLVKNNRRQLVLDANPNAGDYYYFLNKFAFNALYRENARGEFNVPWNKKTTSPGYDWTYTQRLVRGWTLYNGSYETVPIAPGDLVYADPPYDGTFTDYHRGGFHYREQEMLASFLTDLAVKGHPVVASNAYTENMVALYRSLGFTCLPVDAPRRISSDGNRQPAKELIAYCNLK